MRIGSITWIALAALLAGACGDGDGETETARAAGDSAAPLPVADTTTETGTADSASPAAWTLTESGIGPLRVGMTVDEARAALGGEFRPLGADAEEDEGPDACRYAASDTLPAGVLVMLVGEKVARVDVDSGSVATAAGARIGDTEARVRDLYPNARVQPHKYTAGRYLIALPGAPADTLHRIVFETDSAGTVTRFRGGVFPPVEYVEGCS